MAIFTKSDLIFIEPTGEVAKRVARARELFKVLIDLRPENVRPGQPIPVHWSFNLGPTAGVEAVNVRFRVDGNVVMEQAGIPTNGVAEGTGEQKTTIVIADADLAKKIYVIGERRLELEVDAGNRTPYRARRFFHVRPEEMDASWWVWRVPEHEKVEWKQPYQLVGDFHNKAHAAMATVWTGLSEARKDDDPTVDPCDWLPMEADTRTLTGVAPGNQAHVAFARRQDWQWLTPAAWVVQGPTVKLFAYAASFYATDEFGNQYRTIDTAFCSTRISRQVTVSEGKLAAAASAMTATITATAFTVAAAAAAAGIITAPIAAGLLAAAGVAYGVASGFAAIALDPPEPDPRYREPVVVTPLPLPSWGADSGNLRLDAFRRLFEAAARIAALENARTVTRARMMGARVFGEADFVAVHRDGYVAIEREMTEKAAEMERLLPSVQAEVEEVDALEPGRFEYLVDRISGHGLPADLQDALRAAGLDSRLARDLAAIPQDATLAEIVKANGVMLAPLVAGCKRFVNAVRSEHERVFAGENPCQRPPGEEQDDAGDPRGTRDSGVRRKRRCCCEC